MVPERVQGSEGRVGPGRVRHGRMEEGSVVQIYCVMYGGCSGQHRSEVLQLAEPVYIIHPERGADPSHLCWLGHDESVTHMCCVG